MRVVLVGTGYVGLVTGACLADIGHHVTCLDTDEAKIETLRAGHLPIFEPGLAEIVERTTAADRLRFSSEYTDAIPDADLIMLAVGTPTADHGKADLTAIDLATSEIAPLMSPGVTIVVKSTVPVGTTAEVASRIEEIRPGVSFEIVTNPEFLRQGAAVEDFMRPTRIVIGTRSEQAARTMRELYGPILDTDVPSIFSNLETAELIKYASNSFLAVKLSFVNEMADVCEEAGCDIDQLTEALAFDPRIGEHFLNPGPGYGGSCLPKDTQALLHTTQLVGAPSRVVAAAIDVNANRLKRMAKKVVQAMGGTARDRKVAVLGLTFKANTDDLRESPAMEIVRSLIGLGARVSAYDPEGMDQARRLISGVDFAEDAYECIAGADAIAILTEWPEFADLDLDRVRGLVARPLIVDLRNIYDPAKVEKAGFTYHSIGR